MVAGAIYVFIIYGGIGISLSSFSHTMTTLIPVYSVILFLFC